MQRNPHCVAQQGCSRNCLCRAWCYEALNRINLRMLSRKNKSISEILSKYPFNVNAHYITMPFFERRLKEKQPLAIEIAKDHILFGEKEKMIRMLIDNSKWWKEHDGICTCTNSK